MVTLKINGKEITVKEGTLILDAARDAGYYIPTFCYLRELSSLGSCRMCLVEIEGQKKMQPSCVTPVMQDMHVLTETDTVHSARSSMLEFLLSNHALDCPVCDKGGECELQNIVYKHGPKKGVHAEEKLRFHDRDYALSDVIVKNSNRCVQCMRCVRVCTEVVGRGVLGAVGRGAHQEETSFRKSYLDCDHDGMCIEVCPVGCFMRRPYRYTARPWDLAAARSVCPYCATGCRLTVEERDGVVVRSRAKAGDGLNGRMLCARGRFGYDFINSSERLTKPLLKRDGKFEEVSFDEALGVIKERFSAASGQKTGAVASARLTNEELYLFQKLAREVFKTVNVDSSSRWDPGVVAAFIKGTGMANGGTSALDCVGADTLLIAGSQVSEENPVTDYLIRQTVGANGLKVIIASPRGMKLDSSAEFTLRHVPGQTGALLNALSLALFEHHKKKLSDIKGIQGLKGEGAGVGADEAAGAAKRLDSSSSVGIMAGVDLIRHGEGTGSLALLTEILRALGKEVFVMPLLDRCNQRGAWEMGVHPGLGPGYGKTSKGLGCDAMLEASIAGRLDNLYVAGEDIAALYPDEGFARDALGKLKFLVVQDIFMTETAKLADVVLPAAAFAEKHGTFTNQEGRIQTISRLLEPPGEARTDLEIFAAVGSALNDGFGPVDPDSVLCEISKGVPMYAEAELGGVNSEGTVVKGGQGSGLNGAGPLSPGGAGGGEDAAYSFELVTGNHLLHSGRFSMRAEILKGLIKEAAVEIGELDASRLGLSDGARVLVKGMHHEAELTLRTRKGTRPGVAFIAENFDDVPVARFFKRGEGAQRVNITPI